jgi:hypothetical protein
VTGPLEIPTAPAAAACFEAVRERAPSLSAALDERLLPLASDGERPADERVRELRRIGQEEWAAFVEQDAEGEAMALGKSWPCCVEDVVAATAIMVAEGGADRALLERLLAALQEAPPGTLSTARASMRLRGALAAAS